MIRLFFAKKLFTFLIFLMFSVLIPSYSSAKVENSFNWPTPLTQESITDDMKESQLLKALESIQKTVLKNKKTSSLKLIAKAYLLNKLSKHSLALQAAFDAKTTHIDDLRFHIIASSYFENSKTGKSLKEKIEKLKNALKYYSKIIMEYENSPFYENSLKGFDNVRLSLAQNYYENKQYDKAISLYRSIILSAEKELSQEQFCNLYLNLGDSYMQKKKFIEAYHSFQEVSSYNPFYKDIKKKKERLHFLIPETETELRKLTDPNKFAVSGVKSVPFIPKTEDGKLYKMARDFSDANDYEKAIIFAGQLLSEYPGNKHEKDARRLILKNLKRLMNNAKKSIKWGSHYKKAVISKKVRKALSCDIQTLIMSVSALYRQEFLKDTENLIRTIIDKHSHSDFVPKAYLILSRIQRINGNYKKAVNSLKKLRLKYSGSDESIFAIFKEGLLHFENKKFHLAKNAFENFLEQGGDDNRAKALWWLARTFEISNDIENANLFYNKLQSEFPLSFYTVIQNSYNHLSKLKSKKPVFDSSTVDKDLKLSLTIRENMHFLRAISFIKIGLLDYANFELSFIKSDSSYVVNYYIASILFQNNLYRKAIKRAVSAAVIEPLIIDPELLSIIFPNEHISNLVNLSQIYGVDHLLVLSLIKQESAFDTNAVSRSGARGLMQLMPFTADDVSNRLTISAKVPEKNLFAPQVNISIATYYFYQVLKNKQGDVIYALASYNAGPSRAKEWKNQNRYLSYMEMIEQIPVEETNQYVKNIIRNYIFYTYLLDKRIVAFNDIVKGKYHKSLFIRP